MGGRAVKEITLYQDASILIIKYSGKYLDNLDHTSSGLTTSGCKDPYWVPRTPVVHEYSSCKLQTALLMHLQCCTMQNAKTKTKTKTKTKREDADKKKKKKREDAQKKKKKKKKKKSPQKKKKKKKKKK